jgi:hypothetical protein
MVRQANRLFPPRTQPLSFAAPTVTPGARFRNDFHDSILCIGHRPTPYVVSARFPAGRDAQHQAQVEPNFLNPAHTGSVSEEVGCCAARMFSAELTVPRCGDEMQHYRTASRLWDPSTPRPCARCPRCDADPEPDFDPCPRPRGAHLNCAPSPPPPPTSCSVCISSSREGCLPPTAKSHDKDSTQPSWWRDRLTFLSRMPSRSPGSGVRNSVIAGDHRWQIRSLQHPHTERHHARSEDCSLKFCSGCHQMPDTPPSLPRAMRG